MCHFLDPPFSALNFRSRGISFSQITNKSAPEHQNFRSFAAPETIIFKISLPSSRSVAAHGRFTAVRPALWGYSRPELPARRVLQVSSGDPQFHTRVRSRDPHFHARAALQPPHFSLCRGTYMYLVFLNVSLVSMLWALSISYYLGYIYIKSKISWALQDVLCIL